MSKRTKYEHVTGRYFTWRLYQRPTGIWYADGRANDPCPGRHSLDTKTLETALGNARRLDLFKAVELGLASATELTAPTDNRLSLEEGIRLYREHVGRSPVTGGARKSTQKRYKAVFDKFQPFAASEGVFFWNEVSARLLERYATYLSDEEYAYRSQFLELTTIKQATNWLINEKHVPETCRIRMPLTRLTGTDTYCWRAEEVDAILKHCREVPELVWLGNVLTVLACSGMRISELASLRWGDVDLAANMIKLTDESAKPIHRDTPKGRRSRQIKNKRNRSFPIHQDLRKVLEHLPQYADGLVFHGPRNGRLSPDVARRTLIDEVLAPLKEQFATLAGEIGFADGRLHSFRHYFCSVCANTGVPEQVVMQWLGHQDSSMVRHYYHLHDAEAQRQMKRINFVGTSGATSVPELTT